MPASRFIIAVRSPFHVALLRVAFCAAMLLAPLSSGRAMAVASAQADAPAARALILLEASHNIDAAAAQITALGGVVYATFPERALLAMLTPAQADMARLLPGMTLVVLANAAAQPLPPALAGNDSGARAALLAWNASLPLSQTAAAAQRDPAALPARPDSPVHLPPDRLSYTERLAAALPDGQELGPDATQTSEYLLGSVQVDVFLPESNGLLDPQSETWTPAQVDQVMAGVTRGVSWWAETALQRRLQMAGPAAADLIANLVFHTPFNAAGEVSTEYEPVRRPSWDEGLWIGEIMRHMGYSQASYVSAVRQYAHDRRLASGRDWGVVIWVVNSAADSDGMFANGYFGYSYLFGPLTVMTSDNDGWGIDKLDLVTAHEFAHLFGALDEYTSSGCSAAQTSGYLNVANTNCEASGAASEDSIMRSAGSQWVAFPGHLVSTPVRAMLGWRDLDADGHYDPVDTHPVISLGMAADGDGGPIFSGVATDVPWVSDTRRDASINPIAGVDYRLPGGDWQACQAVDGRFDALQEGYICPAAGPPAAAIQVRAVNRVGEIAIESLGDLPMYKVYLPGAFSFQTVQSE